MEFLIFIKMACFINFKSWGIERQLYREGNKVLKLSKYKIVWVESDRIAS